MQAGLITAERPNLVGLGAKLMEQLESKRDFIATDSSLSMVPHDLGHNLVLDGVGDFGINSIAHGQIASKLGIPKAYYDRMQAEAPELLADNANHWFENSDAKRMVRTLHQDARALLSDRFRPLQRAGCHRTDDCGSRNQIVRGDRQSHVHHWRFAEAAR